MFSKGNCALFTLQIPAFRYDFKVLSFNGAEAVSQPYAIRVALVSERTDVDLEALLSRPAFLQFGANQNGIHGRIENVLLAESGKRLTGYELTLVPALHYLQFSRDQRIFQNLTVPRSLLTFQTARVGAGKPAALERSPGKPRSGTTGDDSSRRRRPRRRYCRNGRRACRGSAV